MIEATPLIQAVRLYFPRSNITLLTNFSELFENWCVPDHIVTNPDQLKSFQFDYTFLAYWDWDTLPEWTDISFGKVLKLNRKYCKWFLNPEKEIYMRLIRRIGYRGTTPPLYVSIKHPPFNTSTDGQYVCIVPGGKKNRIWRFKKWPFYSELIDLLLDYRPDIKIFIVGTKEDEIQFTPFPNIIDSRDQLALNETAWILKHAAIVVGNDCGPMHIASAVNVPAIVIFGPTCIVKNAYSGKTVMLYPRNIRCWPCQYHYEHIKNCLRGECIKETRPDDVMDAIKDIFLEK
jgi:ADP-heptose:LPS heptosyltransferase